MASIAQLELGVEIRHAGCEWLFKAMLLRYQKLSSLKL